jgi:hypothetical protein
MKQRETAIAKDLLILKLLGWEKKRWGSASMAKWNIVEDWKSLSIAEQASTSGSLSIR